MSAGKQRNSAGSRGDARGDWLRFCALYLALAAFFGLSAVSQVERGAATLPQGVSIYLCLLLLLGLALIPGFAVWRSRIAGGPQNWRRSAAPVGFFLIPYLIYSAGTGDFRWTALLTLLALAAVPWGVFAFFPVQNPQRMNWQDAVVMGWFVVPVFFRLLGGVWNVPVNLDFLMRLFLLAAGAWAFVFWRPVEGAGYNFAFSWNTARHALTNFAAFAAIALPLGLALGFISWNPRWQGGYRFFYDFLTIFIFVALLEELFFRGLLQNLLEKTWRARHRAQAAASILFGLAHVLHAPFPNWRYVILATIAGWFYGSAYRGSRSLMASATTHALVNTVWHTWFTKV